MKKLNVDFVIKLQNMLIKESGGSKGVRDMNLLISSLESPFQTFGKKELYPDDLDKIINISYSLIKNHAFIDGNKRIGILVLYVLLKRNNFKISWNDNELIKLGLEVASGEMSKKEYKKYVENKLK